MRDNFKNRKRNNRALVILSVFYLSMTLMSCARTVRGRAINRDLIPKITKGKTTKQEIIAMFGKPASYSMNSGMEMLGYNYTKTSSKTHPLSFLPCIGLFFEGSSGKDSSQSLNFTISNGVVVNYHYSESGQENSTDFLRQ